MTVKLPVKLQIMSKKIKLRLFFILFLPCLFLGCTTIVITRFVVSRDVPLDPIFTVIPYNNYYEQVNYANKIEECLIELGVKTVTRPTIKEIVKKQSLETGQKAQDINKLLMSNKKTEAITIESYYSYEEFNADYVIFSDYLSKRVKIVNKETREVLATFQIDIGTTYSKEMEEYSFKKILHGALKCLGINVKDLPAPPEQKYLYR